MCFEVATNFLNDVMKLSRTETSMQKYFLLVIPASYASFQLPQFSSDFSLPFSIFKFVGRISSYLYRVLLKYDFLTEMESSSDDDVMETDTNAPSEYVTLGYFRGFKFHPLKFQEFRKVNKNSEK